MRRVGLTGGIGSGKSTVAQMFADLGAWVVDADAIAREVVAPGSEGLAELVERFGSQILTDNGDLDRAAVAAVVFSDPSARERLNAIVHPLIDRKSTRLNSSHRLLSRMPSSA